MIEVQQDHHLHKWLVFIEKELLRGSLDKKHPFRFVVLSLADGTNNGVSSRYVVLRKAKELNQLLIYTDSRSNKVTAIKANSLVQLLFFNQKKGLQVIISCKVVLHQGNDTAKQEWKNVQGNAKKSYCSMAAPGSAIDSPEEAYFWDDDSSDQHFMVIEALPVQIEFLELGRGQHRRAKFQKNGTWAGEWLVP